VKRQVVLLLSEWTANRSVRSMEWVGAADIPVCHGSFNSGGRHRVVSLPPNLAALMGSRQRDHRDLPPHRARSSQPTDFRRRRFPLEEGATLLPRGHMSGGLADLAGFRQLDQMTGWARTWPTSTGSPRCPSLPGRRLHAGPSGVASRDVESGPPSLLHLPEHLRT
jgi:hypothetical protein